MSSIIPSPEFSDIPLLDTVTKALGGVGNPANSQAQAIANNLTLLKLGYPLPFMGDLAAVIGGYPEGAEIVRNDLVRVVCTVPGNLTDPNVDMSGWKKKVVRASDIETWSGRTQEEVNRNTVFAIDWGVNEIDDCTEPLRAMFKYASDYNKSVDFSGLSKCSIQANARIKLNCDTDFKGALLIPLNGFDPNLTGWTDDKNVMFEVIDESLQIQSLSPNDYLLSKDAFYRGSKLFFKNMDDGYCEIIFDDFKVPYRRYDGLKGLKIPFDVVNNSANEGLPIDLSGFRDSIVSNLVYRKSPQTFINILNVNTDMFEANKQTVLLMSRCKVRVSGFTWQKDMKKRVSCCSLIELNKASEIKLISINGAGMDVPENPSTGTYVIGFIGAANVDIEDFTCTQGWGAWGVTCGNGIRLKNIDGMRIDVHEQGYNITGDNLKIYGSIQYGMAGGRWSFTNIGQYLESKNTTSSNLVSTREDYGQTFTGDGIFIDKVSINILDSTYYSLFGALNIGNDTESKVYLPENISISNVILNIADTGFTDSSTNPRIRPIRITTKRITSLSTPKIYAFKNISIKGIEILCGKKIPISLFQSSMSSMTSVNYANGSAFIQIGDISSSSGIDLLINSPTSPQTVSNRVPFNLNIHKISDNIGVNCDLSSEPGLLKAEFKKTKVTGLKVHTSTKPYFVILDKCLVDYSASSSPYFIDSSRPYRRSYKLLNCEIIGEINLSAITQSIGTSVRTSDFYNTSQVNDKVVTPPTGATVADLFTGYRAPGVYG